MADKRKAYKRVLLKLSGEVFGGAKGVGVDPDVSCSWGGLPGSDRRAASRPLHAGTAAVPPHPHQALPPIAQRPALNL